MGSSERERKGKNTTIPQNQLAEAGSITRPRMSKRSVSQESQAIRSNTSDVSESPSSPSLQSSTPEWRPMKRGRSDASEKDSEASKGETDTVRPKRPRVGGRIEGDQGDPPLFHRVKLICALLDDIFTPFPGGSYDRRATGCGASSYCREGRTTTKATSHQPDLVVLSWTRP